ncbi:MAG: hypothetical protein AAF386_02715 [Pseudomonadota bacterium]
MENIAVITFDEGVQLDSDQLGALYSHLGSEEADVVVCRALEELANRLSLIERSYYQSDFTGLAKATRGLVGIADQVGMKKLANVAQDVVVLAQDSDSPALAAALARLVRLGDRSLTAIWEVQDLNGAV